MSGAPGKLTVFCKASSSSDRFEGNRLGQGTKLSLDFRVEDVNQLAWIGLCGVDPFRPWKFGLLAVLGDWPLVLSKLSDRATDMRNQILSPLCKIQNALGTSLLCNEYWAISRKKCLQLQSRIASFLIHKARQAQDASRNSGMARLE